MGAQILRRPRTVGEAARELACPRSTILRLIQDGPLVGLLFGRKAPLYVCGDSLQALLPQLQQFRATEAA